MCRKDKAIKILSQLVGAAAALTMYSGFAFIEASADSYSDIDSSYSDDEVYIPQNYRDDVLEALGRTNGSITKADLESLESLQLLMEDESDTLSFVNDCTSITEFYLASLSDNIDAIKQIGKLDKLDSFTFDNGSDTVDLNVRNCNFLYNNDKINTLKIYGNAMVEPELVYSMPNLERVDIELRETMPLDLKKIPSLKITYIYGEPYDISINMTVNDIDYLLEKGIVVYINDESFKTMKDIDRKLNNIISTLNITENSSDQEKLDAIIVYALENFTYDNVVDSMYSYDPKREEIIKSFYVDGYLYGALEKDTQICGNYAAFVSAVAARVGLECYMMMSDIHCWNLVKIDGYYYYVDTTWMDNNLHSDGSSMVKAEELFERDDREHIKWYLDEPRSYADYDHLCYNYPEYLEDELSEAVSKGVYERKPFSAVPADETPVRVGEETPAPFETINSSYYVPELSDEQYEAMVYGTLIIVPIGIIIIIIAAVCIVKSAKRKKREKELNRYYLNYKE